MQKYFTSCHVIWRRRLDGIADESKAVSVVDIKLNIAPASKTFERLAQARAPTCGRTAVRTSAKRSRSWTRTGSGRRTTNRTSMTPTALSGGPERKRIHIDVGKDRTDLK